mmetsp:Transcript_7372/g.13984  ORF Transcript_7372/g.13984 Transcript_7372/m.13984 type:complete len:286 (+) Transcript_7372:1721-2578(+)
MNPAEQDCTDETNWNDEIIPKNSVNTSATSNTCCSTATKEQKVLETNTSKQSLEEDLPPHILRWRNLIVPRANEWKENDEILDGSGSPIIKIIQHKKFATPSGPGYSASIGIPDSDTVLAYVERSQQPSSNDNFHIITIAVHFKKKQHEQQVQHIYGKLTQGVFGREYIYSRRSDDGDEYIPIMKATNAGVTLSVFPGLFLPFLCKKYTFKFYSIQHPERLLFTRNQKERFVEFGSKISTTEAVCLAFAIDRMTNPCNCESFQSSQLAYRGNFNFKPGRILGGQW